MRELDCRLKKDKSINSENHNPCLNNYINQENLIHLPDFINPEYSHIGEDEFNLLESSKSLYENSSMDIHLDNVANTPTFFKFNIKKVPQISKSMNDIYKEMNPDWDVSEEKFLDEENNDIKLKLKSISCKFDEIGNIIKIEKEIIAFASNSSKKSVIKMLDLKTGKIIKSLKGHTNYISCLINLSKKIIASSSFDKTIKLWDLTSFTCIKTFTGHSEKINSLIKINSSLIASAGGDKVIKLWKIDNKNFNFFSDSSSFKNIIGHTDEIFSMVKITETTIASTGADKTIKVWDLAEGTCMFELTGHLACVNSLIKINDTYLASGSSDKTIKIWSLETRNCENSFALADSKAVKILIKLDDQHIISSGDDKTIKIWNLPLETKVKTYVGHSKNVTSILFFNKNHLISGGEDNTIRIWDIADISYGDSYEC